MRVLDSFQSLVVDRNITEPRYLVQIRLGETFSYSTAAPITLEDTYWAAGDIVLENVGVNTAALRIRNTNYQHTAAALAGEYLFSPVTIRFAYPYPSQFPDYFPDGYFPADYFDIADTVTTILLFSGFISEIPNVGEWMTINCTRNLLRRYPALKIRPPIANYLPSSGQVITWGGETYRIEI